MMTIKVILAQTEQDERPPTHLFEGEQVSYHSISFENKDDFIKKYDDITGHQGGSSVFGIPDYYWKDKENIKPGIFFCIYYGKKDELTYCLILQNAIVYIVNQGGQTVDKIHC